MMRWLAIAALVYAVAVSSVGWWPRSYAPSTDVWPEAWRTAICRGYHLSEGKAPLALPEYEAEVRTLLDAAPEYPEGVRVEASLRHILAGYRAANEAIAEGDVHRASGILGSVGYRGRYAFYDELSALRERTGEHCL